MSSNVNVNVNREFVQRRIMKHLAYTALSVFINVLII